MEIFKKSRDFESILGQEGVKKQLKSALIMDRNVILVGPPGIGKTTLAKNVAELLPEIEANDCEFNCDPEDPLCPGCRTRKNKTKKVKGNERFVRIQGSPDLTVEDLLGDIDPVKALKFGPLSLEAFTPGKIFKANRGVLFFDEINRCPEKLQNALLQVLEEKKATIGSYDIDLPADFILISTMNPDDFAGTEKISEVFLDRFDLIYMGYPESLEIEKKIVKEKSKKINDVEFPESLFEKTILFIRILRENKDLERVPSVRASIGLYERALSNALLNKRDKVTKQDVFDAVISVVSHRIRLKPSIKYLKSAEEFLRERFGEFEELKDKKEASSDYP